MRGYVTVPPDLLAGTRALVAWFDRAYDWISTLPANPTTRGSGG